MSTTEAPTVTDTEAEKRPAYTSGLRKLADLLDANPDVPLPMHETIFASYNKDKAIVELAAFARAMPKVEKGGDDHNFKLTGHLDGVEVQMSASRSMVCQKREVTKTVVEWHCPDSILGFAAAVDAEVPA